MKKFLHFVPLYLTALIINISICAQAPSFSKIYMPLDIKNSYEQGTRTSEGKPGKNFWQNTCQYKISVTVNPKLGNIEGKEKIDYFNNSPDTIRNIILNTYQDVYKNNSQRAYDINVETEGIRINSIKIGNKQLKISDYTQSNTILNIYNLPTPVLPKSSVDLEIEWSIQLPGKPIAREGFIDSTSAFVGLWYPKIAVYDDVFGWNTDPYNLITEFYSPNSNYNVSISMPNGYLIWATGTLLNQDNYSAEIRTRLENCYNSNDLQRIVDSTTLLKSDEIGIHPWLFKADSVPDFAFAYSKSYLWDAVSLHLKNSTVLVSSIFPLSHFSELNGMTEIIKNSIEYYSRNDPGIIYPYPFFTSFYGNINGSMEYPMMAFDCFRGDMDLGIYEPMHEMVHMYAPFYLRLNETKFAWMDEGFTEFYTQKIYKNLGYDADKFIKSFINTILESGIKGIENMPLFALSTTYTFGNYSGMQYVKSAQMLNCLENLLSPEIWQKCFASFVQTWSYKSPTPYDFMFFVESFTGKDLFWFWDKWFMHFSYPDISIKKIGEDLVIENRGGLPIPFSVLTTDKSGNQQKSIYQADIWEKDTHFKLPIPTANLSKVEVNCDLTTDFNLLDNIWKQ